MNNPDRCQCDSPGFCHLLRRECDPEAGRLMSEVRHAECRDKPHYFEMFLGETQKPCHRAGTPIEPQPQLDWDWEQGPCQHVGETLRSVPCKPCLGRKEVEIRSCSIHGECTWSSGIRTEGLSGSLVKSCRHCEDYQPRTVCDHRGEELRMVETKPGCPTCPKQVVAVHACRLHGECTAESLGIRSEDGRRLISACDKCPDSTVSPEIAGKRSELPQNRPEPNKARRGPSGNGKPKKPQKPPPITGFLKTGRGLPADWLQDQYLGTSVFLLLGGPSLAEMPLEKLSQVGVMVAAANNAATLYRPHLWFMVDTPRNFSAPLWQDPAVMKFAMTGRNNDRLRIHDETGELKPAGISAAKCPSAYFVSTSSGFTAETFLTKPKPAWECELYDGRKRHKKRSVMLVAMRMLYWLGFRTVYLVGADFYYRPEQTYAFAGCDKAAAACGTNNTTMGVLNAWFQKLRPEFERQGFRVYNATPESRLSAFDFVDFEQAIEQVAWQKPLQTHGLYGG